MPGVWGFRIGTLGPARRSTPADIATAMFQGAMCRRGCRDPVAMRITEARPGGPACRA